MATCTEGKEVKSGDEEKEVGPIEGVLIRVLQHPTNILEMSRKAQETPDFREVSEALAMCSDGVGMDTKPYC